jgi:hypothetical protein
MARHKQPVDSALTAPPVDPARVEQTVRWLISGARDADVLEAIQTTWPDQALQPLITAAIEQLAASAEFDREVLLGFCFEATKDLYRRMTEIGDFAGALRAIKQLRELAA